MLGGKTRVWSLPAKHRIRRILGERRERERQLPLAVSLIFSVSSDKCRDRLNCYANTDRRIIPILFSSPSQLISPLQMKSDSMTLLINFRQRAELSQCICTFSWNVSISSYTYWHLTWVREEKESGGSNGVTVLDRVRQGSHCWPVLVPGYTSSAACNHW